MVLFTEKIWCSSSETNPALFTEQNLLTSHLPRSSHSFVSMADDLANAARMLSMAVKLKIENVCCSLTNPVETLDIDEALGNIDQILNAVNCLDSLMRLPDDVYRNISALRNILKNSRRTSVRILRVNTSIWGRTSYDITQDQLQSLIGLRFTVPQLAELLQVSTRTIEHRLAEYSGLARGRERHFRTGKRADNLDTTLFRLPLLALPFFLSSSGRHFAGFPVMAKARGRERHFRTARAVKMSIRNCVENVVALCRKVI